MPELREVMSRFSSEEGVARGLAFEPRPTDVFVATYPKCGTTLMQQIVHGLRTGGDLDFEDISAVVPWLELAFDLGIDPTTEQRANPRAFKTHLDRGSLPLGGRSIYVLRDPDAALVSFYHFFSGWFFEPGAIDLERFALDFVLSRSGRGDYWEHLVSWWPARRDPQVLYLFYEDVVADLEACVRRVAAFIDLAAEQDLDEAALEARIEIATRQSSMEFMRRHPTLWEDRLICEKRNAVMGLPSDAKSTKVSREGDRPGARESTQRVLDAWRARWAETVEPVTGCRDYEALRQRVSSDLG